jgi:hypothetical protein
MVTPRQGALIGIPARLIAEVRRAGGILSAEYEGKGRDGGPSCATVPLIGDWHVESK